MANQVKAILGNDHEEVKGSSIFIILMNPINLLRQQWILIMLYSFLPAF